MCYPDAKYYITFFFKRYKDFKSLSTPIKLKIQGDLKCLLIVHLLSFSPLWHLEL